MMNFTTIPASWRSQDTPTGGVNCRTGLTPVSCRLLLNTALGKGSHPNPVRIEGPGAGAVLIEGTSADALVPKDTSPGGGLLEQSGTNAILCKRARSGADIDEGGNSDAILLEHTVDRHVDRLVDGRAHADRRAGVSPEPRGGA